jgi:hypothetical protein
VGLMGALKAVGCIAGLGFIKARRACSIRLQSRRRLDELNWQSRDVLQRAKSRGVKLGAPKLAEARKVAVERNLANADHCDANVLPVIREIQRWAIRCIELQTP